MRDKTTWSIVTVIAAGLAVYVLLKQKKAREAKKYLRERDDYLANSFSYSKKYGGTEFVL
jgi:hypothetical protein